MDLVCELNPVKPYERFFEDLTYFSANAVLYTLWVKGAWDMWRTGFWVEWFWGARPQLLKASSKAQVAGPDKSALSSLVFFGIVLTLAGIGLKGPHAFASSIIIQNAEQNFTEQARRGRWLENQINRAKRGSVIRVPEGIYNIQDLKIRRTLKLVGVGEVIFQSRNPVAKGLLVPDLDVSLQVENITFRGATSPDRNGAGIRHDGKDLWVINCIFEDNEDGILATGSEDGRVEIRNSTFLNNGYGDGYSHGVYLSSGEQLLVYDSRFIGTKIGHHIKSLAAVTAVTDSYFDDAGNGTSYTLDVTRGGIASITDSFILQRETAENATLINYDASRGGSAISLRVAGNHIINRHNSGRLVRNPSTAKTLLEENLISNEHGGRLK